MFVFTDYRDAGIPDEGLARLLYDMGIEPEVLKTPGEEAGFGGSDSLGQLYTSGDIELQDLQAYMRSRETSVKPH